MSITIWDLFKYIYKWKIVIALVVILSVLISYMYVTSAQTHNSTVIIEFLDESVKDGEAPDGSKFDINEIVSPNVLTEVIDELELSKTVDALRSSVSISPIVPDSETEIKLSKEELGEKYEYYPNTFSVSFSGGVGDTPGEVRDMLESIIDHYTKFYNEKYISLASVNDIAYDDDLGNYDYIDMAEMLSDNLDEIISKLSNYQQRDSDFRSKSTGFTFSDLSKEYSYLSEFVMSGIFSDIYAGQISKDKDKLIKTYTQEKESYLLSSANYLEFADVAKSRMDSFSSVNKEVPNAYNKATSDNDDALEIIQDVHDYDNVDNTVTTYDDLIDSYVTYQIDSNNARLSADKCQDIINKFTGPAEVYATKDMEKEVSDNLESTRIKISELNKSANKVIDDYNAYSETQHVRPLTGFNFYASMSPVVYGLLAGIAGMFVSIMAALAYEIIRAIRIKDEESAKTVKTV